MGFERARAGRRVVEKATRDRVNHSFAATPRSVPSLLPLTRHSGDMLLQSDVDGVGMCVRQAPGEKVLTVAMVLPVGPLFPGGCLPARASVQRGVVRDMRTISTPPPGVRGGTQTGRHPTRQGVLL